MVLGRSFDVSPVKLMKRSSEAAEKKAPTFSAESASRFILSCFGRVMRLATFLGTRAKCANRFANRKGPEPLEKKPRAVVGKERYLRTTGRLGGVATWQILR